MKTVKFYSFVSVTPDLGQVKSVIDAQASRFGVLVESLIQDGNNVVVHLSARHDALDTFEDLAIRHTVERISSELEDPDV